MGSIIFVLEKISEIEYNPEVYYAVDDIEAGKEKLFRFGCLGFCIE